MRRLRLLLVVGMVLSLSAALYCFGGILQAGSLFTGDRAQRNFEFWGFFFLLFMTAFIGCGAALAVSTYRRNRVQRIKDVI